MAESESQSSTLEQDAPEQTDGSPEAQNGDSRLGVLKNKQIAIPLAASVATAAAVFAGRRGPGAVKKAASKVREGGDALREKGVETAREAAEDAGKAGAKGAKEELKASIPGAGLISKIGSKLGGGGGGGGGQKKTRRLPIQRWTDVAVPLEDAYEKWTQFEEFPKFMHRVLSVQREEGEGDEPDKVKWEEKIWFSKRQWEAEISEQNENDRIVWRTLSGTNHSGVVSFHRIDDNLTRVMVTVDFRPSGLIEKMGSGLRFAKRAVQADLARFKAYAEFGRESTGEEPEARELQGRDGEQQEGQEEGGPEASADGGGREESSQDGDEEAADQGPTASGEREEQSGGDGGDEESDEARREREARRAERMAKAGAS